MLYCLFIDLSHCASCAIYTDTICNIAPSANSRTHCNAYSNSNSDADTHTDTYADTYSYTNCDSYGYSDSYPYSNTILPCDIYNDSNSDLHSRSAAPSTATDCNSDANIANFPRCNSDANIIAHTEIYTGCDCDCNYDCGCDYGCDATCTGGCDPKYTRCIIDRYRCHSDICDSTGDYLNGGRLKLRLYLFA